MTVWRQICDFHTECGTATQRAVPHGKQHNAPHPVWTKFYTSYCRKFVSMTLTCNLFPLTV